MEKKKIGFSTWSTADLKTERFWLREIAYELKRIRELMEER